jgi:hypothetical protein
VLLTTDGTSWTAGQVNLSGAQVTDTLTVARGGTGINSGPSATNQFLGATAFLGWTARAIASTDLPTHSHAAGDITSGTLALARGGTAADLSATGGAGQYVKQTTAGGAFTVGTIAAGDLPSHSHSTLSQSTGIATFSYNGTAAATVGLTGQALALHNLGSNGIIARTAADTVAARTISGTANRISVTNGDGVSGNPTINIDANYAGQNTITTVGTVSTGTWGATAITTQYGGTGQNWSATAAGNVPYFTAAGTMGLSGAPAGAGYFLRSSSGSAMGWSKIQSGEIGRASCRERVS